MEPKTSKDNTLLKISYLGKLQKGASLSGIPINGKAQSYPFDKTGSTILPLQDYVLCRNGPQIVQIDLKPLMAYPQYEHRITAKPYNQQFPFSDPQQSQIVVNFQRLNANLAQGIPLKLTFHNAEIVHDTELIGKMSPYLKVLVENVQKWRSKVSQKGDKKPNFKEQTVNLTLKSIHDLVSLQIWDKDMRNDDFIGGTHIRGHQFLNKGPEVLQYPIVYLDKNNIKPAGKIRFQIQAPYLI